MERSAAEAVACKFAALRRRAGRDETSSLSLPNLPMPNLQKHSVGPAYAADPSKKYPKIRSKMHAAADPPKSAKLGRKWAQMGAQNRPDLT